MPEPPAPPASSNPVTEPKKNTTGLAGKKLALKRNHGLSDDELAEIETVEDADYLLASFKENAPPKKEEKKEEPKAGLQLKANFGGLKPEDVPANQITSADDVLRPLKRNANLGLRFNPRARLLAFYDEEYPDGRIG
jgi:hypothetical protein